MGQHDVRGVVTHRPRPPDRSGTVERDGVEIAFDVHDAGPPDRGAAAHLVPRRLPGVEVPGPLPRPPLPGGHLRRTGVGPVRASRGGGARTPTASTPPTWSPCSTPPAPTGPCSSASRAASPGRCTWPHGTRTGSAASSRSRPRAGCRSRARPGRSTPSTRGSTPPGAGRSTTSTTGAREATRTSCGSSPSRRSTSPTPPSRSRTSSRGEATSPPTPWRTPPPAGWACTAPKRLPWSPCAPR